MTTTWVEALRDAVEEEVFQPSPASWLAALALDLTPIRPDDLIGRTLFFLTPTLELRKSICNVVFAIYGDDSYGPLNDDEGELLVVVDPKWTTLPTRPDSIVAIAGKTCIKTGAFQVFRVPDQYNVVTIEQLLWQARERLAILPVIDDRFEFLDIVGCFLREASGAQCEAKALQLITGKKGADAKDDTKVEKTFSDDAKLLGEVAAGVVRKLSEMTGFGDAGEWGLQLAADLRAYDEGKLPWSEVDRGILLCGPPGSGKTTFARALALEANVELVVTTYSDWHGSSGGDSVNRTLKKLFVEWRKKSDSGAFILLVDEMDSIGRRNGNGHNDSWFAPIINAWLAFLDGAVSREGIVVVGCSNYLGNIDPALLRPGRLDRTIELSYPGVDAMAGIIRAHLGPGAVIDETELARAARACRGMSPAQIELLCREARRTARTTFKRAVCADDVSLVIGARRLEALQRPGAREVDRRVAIHEAAHAVAILQSSSDSLTCIEMDAAKTWSSGKQLMTLADVEQRLVVLLAGLAAEQLILGGHSTGVSADLREATSTAAAAHAAFGMGCLGYRVLSPEAAAADAAVTVAVDAILRTAHARAVAMVEASREAIERLATRLQRDRYLDADEIRSIVETGPVNGRRQ